MNLRVYQKFSAILWKSTQKLQIDRFEAIIT